MLKPQKEKENGFDNWQWGAERGHEFLYFQIQLKRTLVPHICISQALVVLLSCQVLWMKQAVCITPTSPLCPSTDSRGVQAGHERLQAQNGEEVQGVPFHGAQLPGGPTFCGLEG